MAKIAKPPIPQKMYRHFAMVAVTMAVMIAMFASGENRQAISEEIEQRQRQAELEQTSAQRARGPIVSRRDANSQGRFAGGDKEDFGTPMVNLSTNSSSAMPNVTSGGATRRGQVMPIPGYSKAYLDSLTEEEYRRLVANLRANGMLDAQQREDTLNNLAAQSAQRSGPATGEDGLVN